MHPAAEQFVEKIGALAERDGLPRIGGRLVGFLLLHAGSFSLDELAQTLQVSKASVSTNARQLERAGLLERTTAPGDRRDYYHLAEDPWSRLYEMTRLRLIRMRQALAEGAATLPEDLDEARQRLRKWEGFYGFLLEELDQRIQRWQARQESRAS